MGHPMRLKLTRKSLPVELANHYSTRCAIVETLFSTSKCKQNIHTKIAKLLTYHELKESIFLQSDIACETFLVDTEYFRGELFTFS